MGNLFLVEVTIPVHFKAEGDAVIVTSGLPVTTQGRTKAEAARNMLEALELFLDTCVQHNTLLGVLREAEIEFSETCIDDGDNDDDGNPAEWMTVPLSLLAGPVSGDRHVGG